MFCGALTPFRSRLSHLAGDFSVLPHRALELWTFCVLMCPKQDVARSGWINTAATRWCTQISDWSVSTEFYWTSFLTMNKVWLMLLHRRVQKMDRSADQKNARLAQRSETNLLEQFFLSLFGIWWFKSLASCTNEQVPQMPVPFPKMAIMASPLKKLF